MSRALDPDLRVILSPTPDCPSPDRPAPIPLNFVDHEVRDILVGVSSACRAANFMINNETRRYWKARPHERTPATRRTIPRVRGERMRTYVRVRWCDDPARRPRRVLRIGRAA